MHERCEIPRCRAEAELTYLGRGICSRHWMQLTNEYAPPDALGMALGIKAEPQRTTEEAMSKSKKKHALPKAAADTAAAAEGPTEPAEPARPEKSAKDTRTEPRPDARKKAAPKEKEDGLVVFAFRLTAEERDAIHKAAGPARASRFVRAVAVAAARDDEAALRETLRQAREGRT